MDKLVHNLLHVLPESQAKTLLACAVPHWFNAEIASHLLDLSRSATESKLLSLSRLSFVQSNGHSWTLHELARSALLDELWNEHRQSYVRYSAKAAEYFASRYETNTDLRIQIESVYHQCISDPDRAEDEFKSIGIGLFNSGQYQLLFALAQTAMEHDLSNRLPERLRRWPALLLNLHSIVFEELEDIQETPKIESRETAGDDVLLRAVIRLSRELAVFERETRQQHEAEYLSIVQPMPEGMTVKSRHSGTVTRVDLGGALISLGDGVDGYLHISKMIAPSGGSVTRVSDAVKVGDIIDVTISAVHPGRRRVDLTMRKLPAMDWSELRVGAVLESAKVVAVEKFGAFVDFEGPKHGLVPFYLMRLSDRPKVGDMLEKLWVVEVNEERRRILFTMFEPAALPWNNVKKGEVYRGKVTRIERNGAYVEIGAEREGLLKSVSLGGGFVNIGDFVAVGEDVDVRVTFVDPSRKRIDFKLDGLNLEDMALSYGPKEETSPFEPAALTWNKVKKGQVYRGKVTRIERNGAYVEIGAEREGLLKSVSFGGGFVDIGDFVAVGEEVAVRVTFVDPSRKRIDVKLDALNPEDKALSSGPMEGTSPMAAAMQRARQGRRDSTPSHSETAPNSEDPYRTSGEPEPRKETGEQKRSNTGRT